MHVCANDIGITNGKKMKGGKTDITTMHSIYFIAYNTHYAHSLRAISCGTELRAVAHAHPGSRKTRVGVKGRSLCNEESPGELRWKKRCRERESAPSSLAITSPFARLLLLFFTEYSYFSAFPSIHPTLKIPMGRSHARKTSARTFLARAAISPLQRYRALFLFLLCSSSSPILSVPAEMILNARCSSPVRAANAISFFSFFL